MFLSPVQEELDNEVWALDEFLAHEEERAMIGQSLPCGHQGHQGHLKKEKQPPATTDREVSSQEQGHP